ncbi:MAG: hypothetical protein KKA55_07625 [Proteobacteria bacterium]|nr:hypothetical protein [Pseudomonadota bacterium]MBU1595390.1 hypothetical protein [Pseudomonadota bacterium]
MNPIPSATAFIGAMIFHACRLLPLPILRKVANIPVLNVPAISRLALHATAFPGTSRGAVLNPTGTPCSILAHMRVLHQGTAGFAGRRVALVAHWDPHGLVDPYVVYYLRHLRELGYATVLVSDRALDLPEDVGDWADAVLWRTCPGYDFTSWKGALEFFPSLAQAEELLLTNDSIFAPTNPLPPVHALMDAVDCDFWGLSEGGVYRLALQSYYLVFRRACLAHPAFWSFWTTVDTTTDKRSVIGRFELTLTSWLTRSGLRAAAYMPAKGFPDQGGIDPVYLCWRYLQREFGFPCVKRSLLSEKAWWTALDGWERTLADTGYPVELIHGYFRRVQDKKTRAKP